LFRNLKKSLISNQTIEPTNIAGFNQFYNDTEGTDAKRYAIAWDQHFSKNIFFGIEFSKRKLIVPREFFPPPPPFPPSSIIIHSDIEENFGNIYFNYITSSNTSLSLSYLYEKFDRDLDFIGNDFYIKLVTQRLPIKFFYLNKNGFSLELKTTYVKQRGIFASPPFFITNNDKDDFWVTDLKINFTFLKEKVSASLNAKNIFAKKFRFVDTDPSEPSIYPDKLILSEFSIYF